MGAVRGGVPALRHARTDRLGVVRRPDGAAVLPPGVSVLARERSTSVVDRARTRVPARGAGLGPARKPRPDAGAGGRRLLHRWAGQPVRPAAGLDPLAAAAHDRRLIERLAALTASRQNLHPP